MKCEAQTDLLFPDGLVPFVVIGKLPSGLLFVAIEEGEAFSCPRATVLSALATVTQWIAEAPAVALVVDRGRRANGGSDDRQLEITTLARHRKGSSDKM